MLPATVPPFNPESYFDTKVDVIATAGEKMKLKVGVVCLDHLTERNINILYSVSCVTSHY